MTEPLSTDRKNGIVLTYTVHQDGGTYPGDMIRDLLAEVDRQGQVLRAKDMEISVYERRERVHKNNAFSEAEKEVLRHCLEAGFEVMMNDSSGFSEQDYKVIQELRATFGLR